MFGRFFAFEMGCPEEDATPSSKAVENIVYDAEPGAWGDVAGQDQIMTLDEVQAQYEYQYQYQYENQGPDQGADSTTLICECKGMGCNKCKKKKAVVITLTGRNPNLPIPVMNLPMAPFQPSMVMMGKPGMF